MKNMCLAAVVLIGLVSLARESSAVTNDGFEIFYPASGCSTAGQPTGSAGLTFVQTDMHNFTGGTLSTMCPIYSDFFAAGGFGDPISYVELGYRGGSSSAVTCSISISDEVGDRWGYGPSSIAPQSWGFQAIWNSSNAYQPTNAYSVAAMNCQIGPSAVISEYHVDASFALLGTH